MRDRSNQKLACASGQTAANSFSQAINEACDRGDIELLERIAKDPQAFILKQGWGWRGLAAGRMTMTKGQVFNYVIHSNGERFLGPYP